MENEIVTAVNVTPMSMMQVAIEKGVDSEQLSKLMDMSERYEANEARKAFTIAMTAFKADSVIISKDKTVSFGATSYTHASLANVVKTITEALAVHELSHSWSVDQEGNDISVTCSIMHSQGHKESTTLKSTADQSGKKNNIQAIGSTITYLQRYSLLAITGLATDDQDDDGMKAEDRLTITEAQALIVDKLVTATGGNDEAFLNFYNINSVSEMQQRDYSEAVTMLERKVRKAGV